MGHDEHDVAVVVMVCVHDDHHVAEVARYAHWHCSRFDEDVHWHHALGHVDVLVVHLHCSHSEKEDDFRHGEVHHGRRALEFLGVVVAGVRGEGHDVHDVRSSTLKYFLFDLSVTTKKIDDVQGCGVLRSLAPRFLVELACAR